MKTLIARWEVKGGKRFLNLYQDEFRGKPSYDYEEDNGGGNIGYQPTDQDAINSLALKLECFKMDFPSLKRVK